MSHFDNLLKTVVNACYAVAFMFELNTKKHDDKMNFFLRDPLVKMSSLLWFHDFRILLQILRNIYHVNLSLVQFDLHEVFFLTSTQ